MSLTATDLTAIKDIVHESINEAIETKIPPMISHAIETQVPPMIDKAIDTLSLQIGEGFNEVSERFDRVETRLDHLESDVATLKTDMREVKWSLADTVRRAEFHKLTQDLSNVNLGGQKFTRDEMNER